MEKELNHFFWSKPHGTQWSFLQNTPQMTCDQGRGGTHSNILRRALEYTCTGFMLLLTLQLQMLCRPETQRNYFQLASKSLLLLNKCICINASLLPFSINCSLKRKEKRIYFYLDVVVFVLSLFVLKHVCVLLPSVTSWVVFKNWSKSFCTAGKQQHNCKVLFWCQIHRM